MGQRLRVLDVGLDGGSQTLRLARAGHAVTALEPDAAVLRSVGTSLEHEPAGIRERVRLVEGDGTQTGARFAPGSFDIVLCHGALMDAPEPDAVLAGPARVLATGGLLSLVVRNADAPAVRPALAGDWAAALAAFDDSHPRHRLEALTATLAGIGVPLRAWYGVGVFPFGDAGREPSAEEFERYLAVEDRAGRRDPYRAIAERLHLCGVRG